MADAEKLMSMVDAEELAELRALLQDWHLLDETGRSALLSRLTNRRVDVDRRRVPDYPHIWVADYPGGRAGLRWTPEQQELPCYCLHCHVPYEVRLLVEDCWARTPRVRVPRHMCNADCQHY